MKIICMGCGHKVDLDDAYDDFDGPVKCFACHSVFEIRTEQGCLKTVMHVNMAPHHSTGEIFERVVTPMKHPA